ncbi:MAG: hypothetical protein D3X82_12655 [Candidatus Leucobacter sulfamidivorax]|nr:hypothetical protein [Candidatus Leucobacter sulfamidivorax]
MEKTARLSLKFGLAAASALALTFGAVAPAFAADIHVGPDAVAGFENGDESSEGYNYDQWHVGSVSNPTLGPEASLEFGTCSVTTLAVPADSQSSSTVTQVLQGFPIDGRPLAALPAYGGDGTVADVQALIGSTSITVLEGSVTIQIPIFEYDGLDEAPAPAFTTVRTELLGPGVYNLADLTLTDSSGWFGGTLTVAQFLEQMQNLVDDDFYYQILGVGFTGSEGAVVQSIAFGGNTYHFGTGSCLPANPTPPTSVQTAAK